MVMVGCDTTVNESDTSSTSTSINNPPPGTFDATGTVTGRVLDRVSSAPIEGATVSLAAAGDSLTATTDATGKFSLPGVPVTTSSSGGSSASTTYSVHITTPDGSSYRQFYRSEVELQFGNTANGGGSADNLAASVTFPLSKLTATVTGRAFVEVTAADGSTDQRPLNGAPIAFVQNLPLSYDAEGNPQTFAQVQTAIDTTDTDGTFTFENVEEGTSFDGVLKIGNEDNFLFSGSTPTGQSGSTELAVGDVNATSTVPAFKITQVSPQAGADVASQTPTIVFTFNRPLADNSFLQSGPNDTGRSDQEAREIANELLLFPEGAKSSSKATNPDNSLSHEVTISEDRTQLSITPREPLSDGFNHRLIGASSGGNGGGFIDPRFTDANGIPLQNPTESNFTFSVGVDNSAPPVPAVSLLNGPPSIDAPDAPLTVDFEVEVDESANAKGYEVYYRTVGIRTDRAGGNGQFVKIRDVTPEADPTLFDQTFGIVPVRAAEFGVVEFTARINAISQTGTPLTTEDGRYGPIEWKIRAVSINNVRGEFTDVIETGDTVSPTVISASATDTDADGNDEFITIEFSEALDTATASDVSNYTLTDGAGTTRDILDSVTEVDNVAADEQTPSNLTTVTITLEGGNSINFGDQIEVSDAVLDLSTNNGVSQDGNDNSATF